jgi:DNA-binding PadR family transcriptional regulator
VAVRESLLALLQAGPAHGYQLKADFEAATGGLWPLNVGQVYTTLDRLVRDGFVHATERDGQKIYEITETGVEELGAWWELTPADDPPPRDELVLKVMVAATTDRSHALDVVTTQRSALLRALQERQHRDRDRASRGLESQLVHDALVVRAEADLRWLDMCEERLLKSSNEKGGKA